MIKPYPYGDYVTVFEGENVGHKIICRFPTVATEQVCIRILRSDGEPQLSSMELFYIRD